MFYRQGGSTKAISRQLDTVYADFIGATTGWLPVSRGNWVAVNMARATIVFGNAAQSAVTKNAVAPECTVLLELKQFGGQADDEAWPIDQWQNMVVATGRRISMDGWVRLRVANFNTIDGSGLSMGLQVNRTGDSGVDT